MEILMLSFLNTKGDTSAQLRESGLKGTVIINSTLQQQKPGGFPAWPGLAFACYVTRLKHRSKVMTYVTTLAKQACRTIAFY